MDKLVNELTQKDENKALKAASSIINEKNIDAFGLLCQKSEFLFDFVKNNVCKRFKKVVNKSNYKNLICFFEIYNDFFSQALIEALCEYADENLTDEIYDLLENGTINQKKCAAKYFYYIPDTIAQETLEKLVFSNDINLSTNCAQALGAMNSEDFYNSTIEKLKTKDEFELIKIVRILTSYGDKKAVEKLLDILDKTSTAENIAGEIPYLSPFTQLLETQDLNKALTCFDLVLSSLGEIFSLGDVFFYEIYDVINELIEKQIQNNSSSHIAQVLLRALDKFSVFNSNDEYTFDETKDTKEEIKAIYDLLNSQDNNFWNNQKRLISKELNQSQQRTIAALEIIQALIIEEAKAETLNFINSSNNEQLIVMACGVAHSNNWLKDINLSNIENKISDQTLKAILKSYQY